MYVGAALLAAPELAADPMLMEDNIGVSISVLRGDVVRLQRISEVEAIIGMVGASGLHRVHGELEQSTRSAQACIDALPHSPPNQAPVSGFLCQSMLAGNALMLGDIAGWAKAMQDVRTRYQRDMLPTVEAGHEVVRVTRPRIERFQDWPRSTLPVTTPDKDVVVPVQAVNGLPTIELELATGGTSRQHRFVVDTGASRSHISRTLAQQLGLAITEDFMVVGVDESGVTVAGLARPVDLVIGGLKVKDVSFNSEQGRTFDLIGIDVLRALGPLQIGKDSLTVFGKSHAAPCTQHLSVTSLMLGDAYQLRYLIHNGGGQRQMLVDTGFNGAFQLRSQDIGEVPPHAVKLRPVVTTRWSQDIRYVSADVDIDFDLDGTPSTVKADVALEDADVLQNALRMGFGATQDYAMYLDVAGSKGCAVAQN